MFIHSEFETAFIMAQHYPNMGFTDVCFYDDGISIPGRFEKSDVEFDEKELRIKNRSYS